MEGAAVKKFVSESWLVLAMGLVFAMVLAGTQGALIGRIRENRQAELNSAVTEVVPGVERFEKTSVEGRDVYKCLDASGKLAGWAIDASGPGFIDRIRLVAGISPDGSKVLGIKVIEDVETPGLGNKIEGGEDKPWPQQFAGKPADQPLVVVKQPPRGPNEIQAITGATYSSKYVTDIVNDIIARIRPKLPRE